MGGEPRVEKAVTRREKLGGLGEMMRETEGRRPGEDEEKGVIRCC